MELRIDTVTPTTASGTLVQDPSGRFANVEIAIHEGETNPFQGGQSFSLVRTQLAEGADAVAPAAEPTKDGG